MKPRRIVIDRIELDLRGHDPAAAREAAAQFGPALQAALRTASSPAPVSPLARQVAAAVASGIAPTADRKGG